MSDGLFKKISGRLKAHGKTQKSGKIEMKLSFLGAAQNVTGSRYFLETEGKRILIDCGFYQERQFAGRNWDPFPVAPNTIDAVMLTHAHLDHCGLLPKLVKEGFRGPIYCTGATAEIAQIIMLDSARLQVEDAEFKKRRHEKEGRTDKPTPKPLYTVEDAEKVEPLFKKVDYEKPLWIGNNIEVTFFNAGHVLGSSMIKVRVHKDGEKRSVVFSGDIGRNDRPIIKDRDIFKHADYLLVESTYGNRVHKGHNDIKEQIAEIIDSTEKAGGNIVVPSFALERAQEILFYISELISEDKIPHMMVFLDSPMAARITEVFKKYTHLFDKKTTDHIKQNGSPFSFPTLKVTGSSDDSKAINHIKGTVMIIAGSGMCTGGRIKHHLVNNISRPESTIMFVGYQAVGTLGRIIVDGKQEVRILGKVHPVKARVVKVNGFSAHADQQEMLQWLQGLQTAPKKIFLVHGEAEAANEFSKFLHDNTGWETVVPEYGQTVILD